MNDIEKDDPLGALMKRTKGPADSPLDVPEEPDDDAALHDSADAFIKAVHAKDVGGVADAFRAMSSYMTPPGEDDMEMPPSSENGAELPDAGR